MRRNCSSNSLALRNDYKKCNHNLMDGKSQNYIWETWWVCISVWTDTLWKIQKLHGHWSLSPKYLNWLMTSNHLQSIGLDNVDIAASKFKIKIRWKVESEGKSDKWVLQEFLPHLFCTLCVNSCALWLSKSHENVCVYSNLRFSVRVA